MVHYKRLKTFVRRAAAGLLPASVGQPACRGAWHMALSRAEDFAKGIVSGDFDSEDFAKDFE